MVACQFCRAEENFGARGSLTVNVAAVNPVALDTRLYFNGGNLPDVVVGAESGAYNTAF